MGPQTCVASTKDWLEASKEMKIRLIIENSVSTISMYQSPLVIGDSYNELKQMGLPFLPDLSVVKEPSLDSEFKAWDTLSDEALLNFEYALD